MAAKQLLDQAKAFLCWDTFPDLTVKLIPLEQPVAFYTPPSANRHTITLFYPVPCDDYWPVLFLLFHEIGHYRQFQTSCTQGKESRFWECVNMAAGEEKIEFEAESWELGKRVFTDFLSHHHFSEESQEYTITQYQKYAARCLNSYEDG